jgi:hypothetical protein
MGSPVERRKADDSYRVTSSGGSRIDPKILPPALTMSRTCWPQGTMECAMIFLVMLSAGRRSAR